LPGTVVPPPVPASRERPPVARARRISNRNGKRVRKARRRYLSALRVTKSIAWGHSL
jgi:hypothetical protein